MKLRKRRIVRVRDELRQWLRSRHGVQANYTKEQIDEGREDLGFKGADDALVAYTFFGADLVPAAQVSEIIDAVSESALEAMDLLADD